MRAFLRLLERKGLLVKLNEPVSPKYEIASVLKANEGRPILFEKVEGHTMKVVGNLYSSRHLLALSLGLREDELLDQLLHAISKPKEPKRVRIQGYETIEPDLSKLPILTHYKVEPSPYITAGVVVVSHERLGTNVSYHRMMVIGRNKVVMRIVPRHLDRFLQEGVKEVAICIGVPPSVALAGAVSVELGKSELAIANALRPIKLIEVGGIPVPQAEIIMLAEVTGEVHSEGPFLDILGLLDEVRQEKVFRIKEVYLRRDPIYQALLPAGSEHKILMGFPREAVIYREVKRVCNCLQVRLTEGGSNWLHCLIKIKKVSPDDPQKAILAAFRVHPSLKHVWVVDEDIDITNPQKVEWAMATRFQGRLDQTIIIREEPGSTLDPSAERVMTSKVGFDLTIPSNKDRSKFIRPKL